MSASSRDDRDTPGTDPFSKVIGPGRGPNGPAGLVGELEQTRIALAEAAAALAVARETEHELRAEVARLDICLEDNEAERKRAEQLCYQAESRERENIVERDRARYAAMRSGQRDPVRGGWFKEIHQGEWTPGRPYLRGQHVFYPRVGDCYCADNGGAPAGEVPGRGRHWEPCLANNPCPSPRPTPTDALDHPVDGEALRQTELWWDKNKAIWKIEEMSDEYVDNVIDYLRKHARRLWEAEADWEDLFVPCPVNSYPSGATWMADTPLMRALLRERRRRRRSPTRTSA